MRLLATAVVFAVALMAPAAAEAANRFASPTGGNVEPCTSAAPCDIVTAVTGDAAGRPHDVTLLPGAPPAPYTLTNQLVIPAQVTVHGAPGARPLIQDDVGFPIQTSLVDVAASSVLRDVSLLRRDINSAAVFGRAGSTIERVHAKSDGPGCQANAAGTLVRDSVCWTTNNTPAGYGLGIFNALGNGTVTATVSNVTAVATAGDTTGLYVQQDAENATLNVNATNVIAQASGTGTDVVGFSNPGFLNDVINANLDHSNYDSEDEDDGHADSTITITNPGAGTNQMTPPDFTNAAAGDFTQASTSTGTRNQGTAGPGLGAFDVDGLMRFQGTAPDIGAHEFPDGPPPPPPPPPGGDAGVSVPLALPPPPAATGEREQALKKCKKKKSKKARKKCRARAQQLPP